MQHVFRGEQTPTIPELYFSPPKFKDANSTCEQSIAENSQGHPEETDLSAETSRLEKGDDTSRRHSSYQAQKSTSVIQRYSLRDNVKENTGKFDQMKTILLNENLNLKAQNQYLLKHVLKLRTSKHHFETSCLNQNSQKLKIEQQFRMQKQRTEEMQRFMIELMRLQSKLKKIDPSIFPSTLRSISEGSSDQS